MEPASHTTKNFSTKSFSTNGSPVYHLQAGTIYKNGKRVVISASYDGVIGCYLPSGKLIWQTETGGFFPNDMQVRDIDGDGLDETLVASADGILYAIGYDGKMLWKYTTPAPLMTLSITKEGKTCRILTGGIEKKLLALSSNGKLLKSFQTDYAVRFIRHGNLKGTGVEYVAVVLAKVVRGDYYLQLFNPDGLKPVWNKEITLGHEQMREGNCYFDLLTADVNKDGKDDIILSQGWRGLGKLSVYDANGDVINLPEYIPNGVGNPIYKMNRLVHVKSPLLKEEYIMGIFGNQILTYNLDLTLRDVYSTTYSYAGGTFDPQTNTFYMGSSISGGNSIHVFNLSDDSWIQSYQHLEPIGRLAEVLDNIENLNLNIENFKRPSYQPKPVQSKIIAKKPEEAFVKTLENVSFEELTSFHEDYDRSNLPGIWKTKKEKRYQYTDSQESIFEYAQNMEDEGIAFNSWAGHGNDPFYMQFETLKGIVFNAPKMFNAFVFPEMERTDDAMLHALKTRVEPLALFCKEHDKHIILRNKNVFWFGTCYLDLWKDMLFNSEYKDVFIPSMEETNCRTQDLSLNAQLGLSLSEDFNHYCARAVTDNAVYDRMWEWSSQQILSHFTRMLLLQATLGADMFMINTHQGNIEQMNPFYAMLDKGIVIIPKPQNILSMSTICLGIKNPSLDYIEHGSNGWDINDWQPEDEDYVFDRLDCFWGGAPILPHDFSYYGTGSRSRMLNFLPLNPYGFVPFVASDFNMEKHKRFARKFITDGKVFYDEEGNEHSPADYHIIVENELKKASVDLPIRIVGDVSWNIVKLDATHSRIYLIDPGYITPAKRQVKVVFQHIDATKAYDILNNENININDSSMQLEIPAGIFRVIDVTHKELKT